MTQREIQKAKNSDRIAYGKGSDALTEYKVACCYYKQIKKYEEQLKLQEKYKKLKWEEENASSLQSWDKDWDLRKKMEIEIINHFWPNSYDSEGKCLIWHFGNNSDLKATELQGLACSLAAKEMYRHWWTPIATNFRRVGLKYWNINDKIDAFTELVKVNPTDEDFAQLKEYFVDDSMTAWRFKYHHWGEAEGLIFNDPNSEMNIATETERTQNADIFDKYGAIKKCDKPIEVSPKVKEAIELFPIVATLLFIVGIILECVCWPLMDGASEGVEMLCAFGCAIGFFCLVPGLIGIVFLLSDNK